MFMATCQNFCTKKTSNDICSVVEFDSDIVFAGLKWIASRNILIRCGFDVYFTSFLV